MQIVLWKRETEYVYRIHAQNSNLFVLCVLDIGNFSTILACPVSPTATTPKT